MLSIEFTEINFGAVLVAAVATFILGAVWYAVLFGGRREKMLGYTAEEKKEMEKAAPRTFSVLFVCYFVLAFVVAFLVSKLGLNSALQGGGLGFLLWLGLAATIQMTGHVTSNRPIGIYVIDSSYQLVYLVLTGAILGAWR